MIVQGVSNSPTSISAIPISPTHTFKKKFTYIVAFMRSCFLDRTMRNMRKGNCFKSGPRWSGEGRCMQIQGIWECSGSNGLPYVCHRRRLGYGTGQMFSLHAKANPLVMLYSNLHVDYKLCTYTIIHLYYSILGSNELTVQTEIKSIISLTCTCSRFTITYDNLPFCENDGISYLSQR